MKKRQKNALLFGAVFLVLIAAFIGVRLAKSAGSQEAETGAEAGEILLMLEPEEVSRIEITYQSQTLALVRDGEAWVPQDHPALALNQTYPESLLHALSPLRAVRGLGEAEKSDFGLDPAACRVRVTAGGSVFALDIGSYNAANSSYYVAMDGENEVWLVSSAVGNAAKHGLCDMVAKDEIPDLTRLTSLALNEAEIVFMEDGLPEVYTPEYQWFYRENAASAWQFIGEAQLEALSAKVSGMTWSEVVDPLPTEAALAGKYGLASPALEAVFNYVRADEVDSGETDLGGDAITTEVYSDAVFTLKIGKSYVNDAGEACYYAAANASGIVYGIPADTAEALLGACVETLLPTDVLRMDWATVDSIEVTAGQVRQRIRITTQLTTDENGDKKESYVFSENDVTLDSGLCEAFMDYLSEMQAETTVFDAEPAGEPCFTMVLHRKTADAFADMTFAITPYNANFSQVSFNGFHYILVSNRDVEELLLRFHNIR